MSLEVRSRFVVVTPRRAHHSAGRSVKRLVKRFEGVMLSEELGEGLFERLRGEA